MSDLDASNFEFVEPRFVSIRPVGTLDAAQMGALMDAIEEVVGDEPYFMLEAFMGDIEGLTPDSRRVAAERLQKLPDRAIALVGGNFRQNILAKLVLTAVTMLSRNKRNVGAFFKDSEKGQEWLRSYAAERDAR